MSFLGDGSGGGVEPHRNHRHDTATTPAAGEEDDDEKERLRQEVAAKDEAMFDLQVSLQAVEAEKDHEIQALKAEHDQQVHLLQEQLRRAINEANVARMRASAATAGQPQRSTSNTNPSGNFPPPMMMSTRGGAAAAASDAVVATNDERNAVVTPVAAAGAAAVNTSHTSTLTAAAAAAGPSSQHLTSTGNDGSGQDSIPREIHCLQSVRNSSSQQELRQQPLAGRTNDRGGEFNGPLLAGKILELVVTWNAGAGRQGVKASKSASVPRVGAGTGTPLQSNRQLSPTSEPSLTALPARVVQTLVRWSHAVPGTTPNVVKEDEVLMFCVEQVVSLHRQQLSGPTCHEAGDSTAAAAASDPPHANKDSATSMGAEGAVLWKVLEWAIVLASPRGRRDVRQKFDAACGETRIVSSTDDMDVDEKDIQREKEGDTVEPQNIIGHKRRRPRSCIRSLKDGMGKDIPPDEILQGFRRQQQVTCRWEESLLRDLMSVLLFAVTRWQSPEISVPACRILLLLLGQSSPSFTELSRENHSKVCDLSQADHETMEQQDPSLPSQRMGALQVVAWLWGLQHSRSAQQLTSSRVASPLHSWEAAATRLIELHAGNSKEGKSFPPQQPRRRLTGSSSEAATMIASTVSNLAAGVPKSTSVSDTPHPIPLPPKNTCELTMERILQWMSASLPLFSSFETVDLASPREMSGPTLKSNETSDEVVVGENGEFETSPPLLIRRLLANILDVLELVVLPLLEDATSSTASRSASEERDSHRAERSDTAAVDIVTLMRFTSRCVSFLTHVARCDPPCPTVVTGATRKSGSDRGGRSALSESLLILLRVEMPTTNSTAASWDRAPSAIAVVTGLLHDTAVLQEGRDPYESAVAAPTAVREEEQKLIRALVGFFHQLLLQVQWERRWRTDQGKVASSLGPRVNGDASSGDGPSSRTQESANKRPLVSFWQLLSPCRHWYVTASALLRYASPNSSTSKFLERDDDIANPDNDDDPHRLEGGGSGSLDEDVRFMLRLQMDELVDDEDDILQEL